MDLSGLREQHSFLSTTLDVVSGHSTDSLIKHFIVLKFVVIRRDNNNVVRCICKIIYEMEKVWKTFCEVWLNNLVNKEEVSLLEN